MLIAQNKNLHRPNRNNQMGQAKTSEVSNTPTESLTLGEDKNQLGGLLLIGGISAGATAVPGGLAVAAHHVDNPFLKGGLYLAAGATGLFAGGALLTANAMSGAAEGGGGGKMVAASLAGVGIAGIGIAKGFGLF